MAKKNATSSKNKTRRKGRYVVYRDRQGDYRWRLVAGNGKVIATSGEGYRRRRDCANAIVAVNADARIEEA